MPSSINFDSNTTSSNFNWKFAFSPTTNRLSMTFSLLFRVLNAILFIGTLTYTLWERVSVDCTKFWFMYLTNWTQIIVILYSVTGVITERQPNTKPRRNAVVS